MIKPTQVKALEGYRIWIEFEDDVQGVVDLSGYAGCGVWKTWEDRSLFESVKIIPYRALGWGEDDVLDMCADWAYMQVADATHPHYAVSNRWHNLSATLVSISGLCLKRRSRS